MKKHLEFLIVFFPYYETVNSIRDNRAPVTFAYRHYGHFEESKKARKKKTKRAIQ